MPETPKTDLYKLRDLQSAGKIKSIILLLEGCLLLCKQAREDEAGRPQFLDRAKSILSQLELSVNVSAGEPAQNIFFLYDYVYDRLNAGTGADIQVGINMLRDLIGLMKEVDKKT
jgi:flagellin-specific chaperone FliS